jgi:hypothetical protein
LPIEELSKFLAKEGHGRVQEASSLSAVSPKNGFCVKTLTCLRRRACMFIASGETQNPRITINLPLGSLGTAAGH